MSQHPDCIQISSVRLSEVLPDIGVNERSVKKKRRTHLLIESLEKKKQLLQYDSLRPLYYFGSLSEGKSTVGLKSDIDKLACPFFGWCAIQDLSEWKPGVLNFLMIQDQTVPPWHCLLQLMITGIRDLVTLILLEKLFFRDRFGRLLLKNTLSRKLMATRTAMEGAEAAAAETKSCYFGNTQEIHGPENTLSTPGLSDKKVVNAIECESWPILAKKWDVEGQAKTFDDEGGWPSQNLKRDCSKTGCFVVPVGSKGSKNPELEWKISPSLAERHLMFSLNITQIRCYVLMKMLLKTHIKPYFEDAISSFICKTVLFHTISNTQSNLWIESNLISCVFRCLSILCSYVLIENCPHFIIPGNNIMAGRFTQESKSKILRKLLNIKLYMIEALLEIDCDDFGERLRDSNSNARRFKSANSIISYLCYVQRAYHLNVTTLDCLYSIKTCNIEEAIQTLLKYIFKLKGMSHQDHEQNQNACMLLTQPLYTTLGCVLASLSIEQTTVYQQML